MVHLGAYCADCRRTTLAHMSSGQPTTAWCLAVGVLLEAVSEPVRQYLRTRQDTIRCIVTMLTDDSGSGGGASLIDELGRNAEAVSLAGA